MKEKKVRKTVESERQIEMLHSLCLPVHVYKIEQYGEDSLTCRSISPFSPDRYISYSQKSATFC